MKVLSILLLFTAAVIGHASEISQNLRGGDVDEDINFLSSEGRELTTDCVSRSTYMGCYRDRNQNRAMSFQMPGKGYTARQCESECIERGYSFFARQWVGQCFCSNTESYEKHGPSSGCNCCERNVGPNRMCAYKVDTDDDPFAPAPGCARQFNDAPYLGCYKDRNRRRALPYEVHGRPHSAEGCMNACNEAGYKYFARQWRGQCFCGNGDYKRFGPENNCNCCGRSVGPNRNCVWEGDPVTTTTTTTTSTTTEAPETTIDSSIFATDATEPAVSTTVAGLAGPSDNIVEVAIEAEVFQTLVAAVQAAGLVEALTADGPFTVLAPIDEAFAKFPEGTVEDLLLPDNIDTLKLILLNHVIEGEIYSSMVTSGPITTLSGYDIIADVSESGEIVFDGDSNVVLADVMASNGIVHAIDTVLLPEV